MSSRNFKHYGMTLLSCGLFFIGGMRFGIGKEIWRGVVSVVLAIAILVVSEVNSDGDE